MATKPHNRMGRFERLSAGYRPSMWAANYVCWCDYLRPRAWRLWSSLPGTYRLYKWCERHQ